MTLFIAKFGVLVGGILAGGVVLRLGLYYGNNAAGSRICLYACNFSFAVGEIHPVPLIVKTVYFAAVMFEKVANLVGFIVCRRCL